MRRDFVPVLMGGLGSVSGALSAYGMHRDIATPWGGSGRIWLGPGLLFALALGGAFLVLRIARLARVLPWAGLVLLVWAGVWLLWQSMVSAASDKGNWSLLFGAGGIAGAIGAFGVGLATRVLIGGFRTSRALVGLTLAGFLSGLSVFLSGGTAYPVFILWQGVVAACLGAAVGRGVRWAHATRGEQVQ